MIKKFIDKKTIETAVGVGAGFVGGTVLSESGAIAPVVNMVPVQYQNYAEAAIKLLGGAYIHKKMKGNLVKNAGIGLAASAVVDIYQAVSGGFNTSSPSEQNGGAVTNGIAGVPGANTVSGNGWETIQGYPDEM